MDKSRNILVLGAGALQVPLIQKILEKDYTPVVVSLHKDEPGMLMVNDAVVGDFCDEEFTLAIARQYNICAVVTDQTDIPVRTAAYVAEKLKLPGIGYDTAVLFTDKFRMRKRCQEIGVKVIPHKLCYNLNDIKSFYDSVGGPIILKPINNQGSKGVCKVSNESELSVKYEESVSYSRGEPVLAEQFLQGEELVIESVTIDGKTRNLICGDTYYFGIEDAFSAKQRRFPSIKDADVVNRALSLNLQIVNGFGLRNGITHGEYIVSGDEVYLIEIAARGGGVYISSDIIPLMTGFDTCDFIIDYAVGKDYKLDISDTKKTVCYLAFYLPQGRVRSLDGIEDVKSLSFIHHHNLSSIYIGKENVSISDKTTRYFMVIEAPSMNELERRINYIKETLKIKTATDTGELGIIWD